VLAALFDGLLLVSSWGDLEGEALAEVLDGLHESRDKLLGVVLNRVELRRLEQYGAAGHVPAPHAVAEAVT
jgi:Mrp family chromosome partitioning ATPase